MTGKLCFVSCRNFHNEVAAAIAAEGWEDVVSVAFPVQCTTASQTWEQLGALLPTECTQVVILGQACVAGLPVAPASLPPIRIVKVEHCFHLVAGNQMVSEAISGGGFLFTPAWLANWDEHLIEMGFETTEAGNFFPDGAKELVLLDTGTDSLAKSHLADLRDRVKLYARRMAVGTDYTGLLLTRLVLEWRLEDERRLSDKPDHLKVHKLERHGLSGTP